MSNRRNVWAIGLLLATVAFGLLLVAGGSLATASEDAAPVVTSAGDQAGIVEPAGPCFPDCIIEPICPPICLGPTNTPTPFFVLPEPCFPDCIIEPICPPICLGPTNTPTDTPTPVPPAPIATDTPTPLSPVPTDTPVPGAANGDVDCSGLVNAIDVAFLLQFNAGLLGALPCPDAADVSGDGMTNAIDASLILQFSAGLLAMLPV